MATPYHNNTCEKCGKMGYASLYIPVCLINSFSRATVFAGSPTKICATCHGATVREKLQARKAERADARAERKAESKTQKIISNKNNYFLIFMSLLDPFFVNLLT